MKTFHYQLPTSQMSCNEFNIPDSYLHTGINNHVGRVFSNRNIFRRIMRNIPDLLTLVFLNKLFCYQILNVGNITSILKHKLKNKTQQIRQIAILSKFNIELASKYGIKSAFPRFPVHLFNNCLNNGSVIEDTQDFVHCGYRPSLKMKNNMNKANVISELTFEIFIKNVVSLLHKCQNTQHKGCITNALHQSNVDLTNSEITIKHSKETRRQRLTQIFDAIKAYFDKSRILLGSSLFDLLRKIDVWNGQYDDFIENWNSFESILTDIVKTKKNIAHMKKRLSKIGWRVRQHPYSSDTPPINYLGDCEPPPRLHLSTKQLKASSSVSRLARSGAPQATICVWRKYAVDNAL